MKVASYREAVEWIAGNDEPMTHNVKAVAGFISTCLVADLFGVKQEKVAAAVVRLRRKWAKEKGWTN